MKNILILILGVCLLLINNYLGHINPPFSIDWTPVLLGLFTGLILFITDFRLILKFTLITSLIIANDILIKLFAGGTHDSEGAGWIMGFLFLGLIISFILMIVYGFMKQKNHKKEYFFHMLITVIILFCYLFYFNSFGLVSEITPTENVKLSKEEGIFISNIRLSDSIISYDNDTFQITHGWLEEQTVSNHTGIFKKIEKTDKLYCTLILNGNFKKLDFDRNIYYKLNDSISVGYSHIDSIITFTVDKNKIKYNLGFYKNDLSKIKDVEIRGPNNK